MEYIIPTGNTLMINNPHSKSFNVVVSELKTSVGKGLNRHEAEKRLESQGRNKLPEIKKTPVWKRLLLQFHNVLIYVLLAAAVITAFMEHWIDTWVIFGVVVINAYIGFVQEGKAEKALDGIRKMLSLQAIVIRDGKQLKIPAEEVVIGDLVKLKAGDKIPADLRLVKVKDLRVEESALTGESNTVKKSIDKVEQSAIAGDQKCMAFSGTTVSFGEAMGIVTATAENTELGKINAMMRDVGMVTTPLLQQIKKFGTQLSVVIILLSAAFFSFGYWVQNYDLTEIFLAVIGLVVAAIPEGLPAIMTITLAIGVQRMASRNAIIRRLPSVETLGAVNVICSDKTGTLTKNEMTATQIITQDVNCVVSGSGYNPKGEILNDKNQNSESLNWLLKTIRATNTAEIYFEENQWKITGSPTEAALLVLAKKGGTDDFTFNTIDHIPFSSEHKYAAQLVEIEGERKILITGAPDNLLALCKFQGTAEKREKLQTNFWEKAFEEIATQGKRLLGAAMLEVEPNIEKINHESLKNNLSFLGVIGIIDPPRDEAIQAIRACKNAGVQVKMITGDHKITALTIGKQLGIGDGIKAITGAELESKSDGELQEIVTTYDVYARTSPEHKLRLVKAIQANGLRCAMTGDGVNDAPALKKADIGIAMGIKGTEVSKDASEMVLADDNFSSIVHAIEEGRTVYDNIRKSLLFILPTNGAESLVLIAAIILGMVMPITPPQILWANMVTAVTLALALAFEPAEANVMNRSPRNTKSALIGKKFLGRIGFVSVIIGGATLGIFYYLKQTGMELNMARTIAVNTLVSGQLFYLFNCRTIHETSINKDFFKNPYVFIAGGALLIFQLAFVYLPIMQTLFDTTSIHFKYWIWSTLAGMGVFILVEIEKWIGRLRRKKQG
ncbi:MAG: cation-transporting P-type ATPase [Cryomorphaceae bacterium]|nr:cation-transporting P-type ATPase [Cryomorphaceae bacterium]